MRALLRHRVAARASSSRASLSSSSTSSSRPAGKKVAAIVYGSFCRDRDSHGDALSFYDTFMDMEPHHSSLQILPPVAGNKFDFDSLATIDALVVSTSSWFGDPPTELRDFAHNLLLTAETNPGCLSHLQHTVFGNGDPRWFQTFMNAPRYMDKLLETAGSRRFYARGECGEPHAPCGADFCDPDEWAVGMWNALVDADASQPQIPWDAQWEYLSSPHHHRVTEWDLRHLVTKHGTLEGNITSLARPGASYFDMLEAVAQEKAAEKAELEARRRARSKR